MCANQKTCLFFCGLLASAGMIAAETVSTAGSSGSWHDALRWSAGIPVQTNDAVIAGPAARVSTWIAAPAAARTVILTNENSNSSIEVQTGGTVTLYGEEQIAGAGRVAGGSGGSITVSQTDSAAADSVLNLSSAHIFSLSVGATAGTAYLQINSNQQFQAINTVVGNGSGSSGQLILKGELSMTQRLRIGNHSLADGMVILDGGLLAVRFGIESASSNSPALIFNHGRLSAVNYDAVVSNTNNAPLFIQLAGTGTHEFHIPSGSSMHVESTAKLIDKPGEAGTLLKTGRATLTFSGTNTYSGGTTVREGTLAVTSDGALGSGDIIVETAALLLSGGTAHDYINDDAALIFHGSSSGLYLGFEGTDTVSAVSLDGGNSWLAAGVYDAATLETFGAGFYSGDGHLHVLTAPGPEAVPLKHTGIWDMSQLRTNAVSMQVISTNIQDGYIYNEIHFFITNTAGTVDRFYTWIARPQSISGKIPLAFMLHGGGGHASRALAKVPVSNLPAGEQIISVALDYGTHTGGEYALHTTYGAPAPESFSTSPDVNEEILYRDITGFRRILDYMLEEPDVDETRVGVFGASWGGFRTMLWAGVDDRIRVAAAAPGGGGMRDSESQIGRQAAALPDSVRERWYQEFDPLSHAATVMADVYLEAPANDWWFWLGGIEENFRAVMSPEKRWLVIPNNNHGFGTPDSERFGGNSIPFMMNKFFGSSDWPEIDGFSLNSRGMTYEWECTGNPIVSSELYFSPGQCAGGVDWPSLYWVKIPAQFYNGRWNAVLPDRFFEMEGNVFVTATDTNGLMASSLIHPRGGRNPMSSRCSLWERESIWDAQENSWRPNDTTPAVIEKEGAAGVRFTPVESGALSVCNNSIILASPYASARQGIRLVLNGNGTAGTVSVELHKRSQVPGSEIFSAANIAVNAGDTEIIIPWNQFISSGASSAPYPFNGIAIKSVRAGNAPLTLKELSFHVQKTVSGVPYWWLIDHGFSGDLETAAAEDEDADGMPTWQEYFAGTNPVSNESVFHVMFESITSEKAALYWEPVFPGRTYTVESAGNLLDGFSAETPLLNYPACTYTSAVNQVQKFFRVKINYTGEVAFSENYQPPGVSVLDPDGTGARLMRYNERGDLVDLRVFGVNWYDAFSRYMENCSDRSFVTGFDYLAAHNIPVARIHVRGHGPAGWKLYFEDKEEYYRRMDDFIAVAEQKKTGLLIDLLGGVDPIGDIVNEAVKAGYLIPGIDFRPPSPLNRDIYNLPTYAEYRTDLGREDSGSNAFIAYFTKEFVTRYKNSPAVWGWEFANEANNTVDLPNINHFRPQPSPSLGYLLSRDDTGVPAWTSADDITREHIRVAKTEFARSVRAADSWRFICSGDSRPRPSAYNNWKYHNWGVDTKAEIVQVLPMDNPAPVDTTSLHIYQMTEPYFADGPVSIELVTGDYEAFLAFFKNASDNIRRPMIIGEWGAPGDGTTQDEKTTYHRFLKALVDTEVQLSLLWNFDNRHPGQIDEWAVNPGTAKEYQLTNDDPALLDLEQANTEYGRW